MADNRLNPGQKEIKMPKELLLSYKKQEKFQPKYYAVRQHFVTECNVLMKKFMDDEKMNRLLMSITYKLDTLPDNLRKYSLFCITEFNDVYNWTALNVIDKDIVPWKSSIHSMKIVVNESGAKLWYLKKR